MERFGQRQDDKQHEGLSQLSNRTTADRKGIGAMPNDPGYAMQAAGMRR